jgi:hypothetical protein
MRRKRAVAAMFDRERDVGAMAVSFPNARVHSAAKCFRTFFKTARQWMRPLFPLQNSNYQAGFCRLLVV